MFRALVSTAAFAAAVAVLAFAVAPRRHLELAASPDGSVAGIIHVHTSRSDGLSSPDEIAAAAARAGLKFIIFTDHGDATRKPDPPEYRSGVLCLDGVEVSTSGGHYIAIDMPAAPYPLGGDPRDVVEDVRRLGGFGIVSHPDSPKAQLQWTAWTALFDGIELLNLDTSWRVIAAQPGWAPKRRLLAGILAYPVRAPEVMAAAIQPSAIVERWAAIASERRLVVLAGADAHAKLAPRSADPGDSSFALPLPGYASSFRVMSVHVRPDRELTGSAGPDAAAVLQAIRNGHLYTAVDGIATPPSFDFSATNALGTAHPGDVLGAGGPVQLHVQSNAPSGFVTVVREGARTLSSAPDAPDLTVHGPDGPGVYWAEIVSLVGSPPVVWVRSNPIYVRSADPPAPQPQAAPRAVGAIFDGRNAGAWNIEHDAQSVAALDVASAAVPPEIRFRFGLGDGPVVGQYASLTVRLPAGVAPHDGVRFTIRAERPMRISLQVRDTTSDRWQRSVYIDASPQERTVRLADLTPIGTTHAPLPAADAIRNIMFVVDTTNTKPGTSGRIWVSVPALVTSAR